MLALIVGAIILGGIASYYLAVIRLKQLLLISYHAPFRLWASYLSLYDATESRYTYEMLGGSMRFKNYRKFTNMYAAHRPRIVGDFERAWNASAIQVGRDYGLVLLGSIVAFWSVYWAFIISFGLVQLGYFIYVRFYKGNDLDMFVTLMLSMLLEGKKNGPSS